MRQIFHIPIGITQYTKEFYFQTGIHFPTVKKLISYYSKNSIQHGEISFKLRKGVTVDFKYHLRDVDRWIIKPEDILIKPEAIDKGRFGSIYRGVLYGEKDVAVKTIKTPSDNISESVDSPADALNTSLTAIKSWEEEIEAIKILQHENIVLLYGLV